MFPTYLLDKVYVPKSLQNTPSGFTFTLKNIIEPGTLGGVKGLLVDGAEVPLASITMKTAAGEQNATAINYQHPVPLRYNGEAAISVAGEPLAAGRHELKLIITVLEAGRLEVGFADEIG